MKPYLGTCLPHDDKKVVALQAADMYASRSRLYDKTNLVNEEVMHMLSAIPCKAKYWPEDRIRKVIFKFTLRRIMATSKPSQLDSGGGRPMLYKYRALSNLQFALDIFVNERLHAAAFKSLNDPMEGSYSYEHGTLTGPAKTSHFGAEE